MEEGPIQDFSDAHFAAIVEHSSDAIVSKNLDGIVQSWNAAAERLFGIPAAEMIGQSIRRIIPADRQSEEDAILKRVRAGELVPKFETLRLSAHGHEIPVAITVSPIRDATGRIVGASKIANDLREQMVLRGELEHSRLRFEALANNIPQFAWMADAKGSIFWYNQRWYDFTGTDLEQMRGWGWKAVHHPDHVDRVVASVQHSWDTGEPWEDIFPLRAADGHYRWFLSRAQPVRNAAGEIVLWCGTNTDITEEREKNDRIRLLMNEVNHRARNMLATIQAIINRTVSVGEPELVDSLTRRIRALAANQDLLTDQEWAGASVDAVVRSQVLHVLDTADDRFTFEGPVDLMLLPAAAEALGLAIHELATNAAKYGALSADGGTVVVRWRIASNAGERRFEIEWREYGGPPVTQPTRSGFGSILIRRNPEMAMHANVTLDYAADGLLWRASAPERILFEGARRQAQGTAAGHRL